MPDVLDRGNPPLNTLMYAFLKAITSYLNQEIRVGRGATGNLLCFVVTIASDARTLAIAPTQQMDEPDSQLAAENVLPLKFLLNLSIFTS